MTKSKFMLLTCIILLLSSAVSTAAEEVQDVRTRASNTQLYFDAGKIVREEETIRFKLYASTSPADQRVVEEVTLNCESHEMSRAAPGSKPPALSKIFAGEALYDTARQLCGWGAGFWKRLAD